MSDSRFWQPKLELLFHKWYYDHKKYWENYYIFVIPALVTQQNIRFRNHKLNSCMHLLRRPTNSHKTFLSFLEIKVKYCNVHLIKGTY